MYSTASSKMVSTQNRSRPNSYSQPVGAVRIRGKDDGCCSISFVKMVVHMFNTILLLSGITLIAVGVWTLMLKNSFTKLLTSGFYPLTVYLLLGCGCAIVLFVFYVGCLGVCKELPCCLMFYSSLLMLLFIVEAGTGVLAYLYETTLREELTTNLNDTMLTTYKIDSESTVAVDRLQQKFGCCGAGNYLDWPYSVWLRTDNKTYNLVPDSCCITPSPGCGVRDHPSNIFTKGCLSKLEEFLSTHLMVLGAVGLGLCGIQLFGIIFSCCLARKIEKWRELRSRVSWR